jgi:large subunit ribosomal protein L17
MRHRKLGRQFGRDTSHRRATLRALATNLLLHERIETTDAKAKELRRIAERLITRAVRLGAAAYTQEEAAAARRSAAKREVASFLLPVNDGDGAGRIDVTEKVFVELARRYEKRPGGYTRIIKIGPRRGDNAPMSIIELVDRPEAAPAETAPAAE